MFVLEKLKMHAQTNAIAQIHREESLSFAALYNRSNSFAHWLLEQFGQDTTPILIYGSKEVNFLPCVYGALLAGHAYVPVDLTTPPDRVAEIIATIQPKVIVDFSGQLLANTLILSATALEDIFATTSIEEIPTSNWVKGESPAYILFTSGSTGKPKGVPITAKNLTNFYHGMLHYMEEGGVILNQVSYSFDVSGLSLYVGISCGKTLFTVDPDMTKDLGTMFDYLKKSKLTTWVSTPSFAELCVHSQQFSSQLLPDLQTFLFCGEVLSHKLCDQLAERFPNSQTLNTYGPTEATVLVTAVWVTKELRESTHSIPIGAPIGEVVLRLVDEEGVKVEQEEAYGELIILSDSVSSGYYKQQELTKHYFFQDALIEKRGYRTGDICYKKDGLYYYHCRADNQLKLNGHRIELEDIENNLMQVSNIEKAVVVPLWEGDKVSYLVAFISLEEKDDYSLLQRSVVIKKQSAAFLPDYMIPRRFIVIDTFPLNKNGKIDRQELASRVLVKAK